MTVLLATMAIELALAGQNPVPNVTTFQPLIFRLAQITPCGSNPRKNCPAVS